MTHCSHLWHWHTSAVCPSEIRTQIRQTSPNLFNILKKKAKCNLRLNLRRDAQIPAHTDAFICDATPKKLWLWVMPAENSHEAAICENALLSRNLWPRKLALSYHNRTEWARPPQKWTSWRGMHTWRPHRGLGGGKIPQTCGQTVYTERFGYKFHVGTRQKLTIFPKWPSCINRDYLI